VPKLTLITKSAIDVPLWEYDVITIFILCYILSVILLTF